MSLHVKTPYLKSIALSKEEGPNVYMKLDALQASGSFKDRGMLRLCQEFKQQGMTRMVSSSGGNAGLAVAYSGKKLGMEVHVVVPKTTKQVMIDKIRKLGATVEVHGNNWDEANEVAKHMCDDPKTGYAHPFDHKLLWEGHSSIIDEICEQTKEDNLPKPDAIICVVGGGGLLCGIYEGLERNNWTNVDVIAVETKGAESFNKSFLSGKHESLSSIESIATSLGSLIVTPEVLARCKKHPKTHSLVVSDADAVSAICSYAHDHRLLVEPACAAGLSILYTPTHSELLSQYSNVAVVVCGGSAVTLDLISQWKKTFDV
eukprot:TRINITY_DN17829_c0_g1_i1.p1 TRINITY_DN17829_c0_g1~~TRINITY_DN17829_c0_g1_i1.p1  ORF type:complete len:335 (+),score=73.08 TRINITY_DN17829_c0_g1_i1:56-1006(+)